MENAVNAWTATALSVALLVAGAPGRAAPSGETEGVVLVMDLRAVGTSESEALGLTLALADILSGQSELEVVTVNEVNELIEYNRAKTFLDCADESCIAQLYEVANAAQALSGSLGRVGENYVLNLSLLDVARARPMGSASREAKSMDALRAQLPALLAETFGWEGGAIDARERYRLPEGETVSIAVFDLKSFGLDDDLVKNLTQLLAVELKRIEGASVVSRDDIASMLQLEADKVRLDCDDEMSCLAEIGGALGVDKLVVGHVGTLGEEYVVSLRLIDVRTSVVQARVGEMFAGGEEQLAPATRLAGWRLFGIEPADPGMLSLAASAQEGQVFVDDQQVGVLPMPPLRELAPGKHAVRIDTDGFFNWRSDVYVESGTTTPLWAELAEEPPAFYETWWFWTSVGLVVAGSVAATVAVVETSRGTITANVSGEQR